MFQNKGYFHIELWHSSHTGPIFLCCHIPPWTAKTIYFWCDVVQHKLQNFYFVICKTRAAGYGGRLSSLLWEFFSACSLNLKLSSRFDSHLSTRTNLSPFNCFQSIYNSFWRKNNHPLYISSLAQHLNSSKPLALTTHPQKLIFCKMIRRVHKTLGEESFQFWEWVSCIEKEKGVFLFL